MSSLEILTGKPHLSHSSFAQFVRCGEQYRLSRVKGYRDSRSWAMLGGSAVHKATEDLDLGRESDVQIAWDRAWAMQHDTITPGETIRATGRSSNQWPNKENADWWDHHGPQHVQAWVDWWDARLTEGWNMLGVELPFECEIEGVLIVGYIDRLVVDNNGQVRVIDLKSGARKEASLLQLAIYRLALAATQQPVPELGAYFRTRFPGTEPEWAVLSRFRSDLVGRWLSNAKTAIEQQIFIPNIADHCSWCGVKEHCTAWGGED